VRLKVDVFVTHSNALVCTRRFGKAGDIADPGRLRGPG
jgi:hypothetical protein